MTQEIIHYNPVDKVKNLAFCVRHPRRALELATYRFSTRHVGYYGKSLTESKSLRTLDKEISRDLRYPDLLSGLGPFGRR